MNRVLTLLVLLALGLSACDNFFGLKTDDDFLGVPNFEVRPVAYVPILPAIEGLVEPVDVHTGFDQLIYVVDAGTEDRKSVV